MIYTICFETKKLCCILFNDDEEKEINFKIKYYNIKCQYLNYNGQLFEKASVNLAIVKFHERKHINTFKVFPLQYHLNEKGIKAHLTECSQKFIFMLRAHHCHCQSTAFYVKEKESVKVFINSQIMLNTAFFQKMNLNYTQLQPEELMKKKTDDDEYLKIYSKFWKKQIFN